MKVDGILILACVLALAATAGTLQLRTVKFSWDSYGALPPGASNAVFTLYKSTSLGSVFTPWKPTAITIWPRTNLTITVLPGIYRFRMTITTLGNGESAPSNTITNTIE
jgi:hypothetical protein